MTVAPSGRRRQRAYLTGLRSVAAIAKIAVAMVPRTLFAVSVAVLVIAISDAFADEPKKTEPPKLDPISLYIPFERQGFKVMVSPRLVEVGSVLRNLESH